MRLVVRSSAIHAAGVFTLSPIPKGTRIVEYTGERLKHDDADELYKDRPYTYLFGVGDGTYVVDGFGMAMYVNHSCDPNCETEEDDDERVWIVAARDISAGEELAYDYFLYDGEGEAPCTCGSKGCRGTMYSPKELKKREREVKANARKRKNASRKRAVTPTTRRKSVRRSTRG
jgi:SET domain-containing protein